jgi:integrase
LRAEGLSGSTVKNTLKPLQGTMKLALRRGLIPQNPFDLLMPDERPKEAPREQHEWSPREIDALLSSSESLGQLPEARYDYSTLLRTAIYVGPRIGELLGLRWCDVDLKNREIHIRHQIRGGQLVAPKTPKAARRVPLGDEMSSILRRHKLASKFSAPDDFVFASNTGTALNPTNVRNRGLNPALRAAGLDGLSPKITFHSLRHAFASIMIPQGVTSVVLADLMGHTDSRTTERIYIHLFNRERTDEQVREAMQAAMKRR